MSNAEWVAVAGYDDVPEDGTLASRVEEVSVCLYKVGGEIYATDNRCTHGDAELSEGLIQEGGLIECPLHEGMFDIRTGKAVAPPCTRDLHTYEAKVEAAVIYLRRSARAT